MKNNILILVVLVVVGGGMIFFARSQTNQSTNDLNQVDQIGQVTNSGAASQPNNQPSQTQSASAQYQQYSPQLVAELAAEGKRPVLFFHASWCPTCRQADKDLTQNTSGLPADVVVLKTDYDKEKELKEKYQVTYQHTFVQVDGQGEMITKWSGGGVKEIASRVK